MAVLAFVIAFVAVGLAVGFIAFFGGPGGAREAYLTRGGKAFRVFVPIFYVACGIAVPALVIADNQAAEGSQGPLASKTPNSTISEGKTLFRENCWSCHTLAAAGARGVTGPNLDQIGQMTPQRVLNAIRIGGTGDGRMPAGILPGACDVSKTKTRTCHAPGSKPTQAEAVAAYVSAVAGQ
jgi:mono/diheme cytochrome c family protein